MSRRSTKPSIFFSSRSALGINVEPGRAVFTGLVDIYELPAMLRSSYLSTEGFFPVLSKDMQSGLSLYQATPSVPVQRPRVLLGREKKTLVGCASGVSGAIALLGSIIGETTTSWHIRVVRDESVSRHNHDRPAPGRLPIILKGSKSSSMRHTPAPQIEKWVSRTGTRPGVHMSTCT